MTDLVTHDAREFGLHLLQGGWRMGLLVARNVVRAPGRVRAETLAPKTNASEFAKVAGTTNDRVLRYLDAWEIAADAGHVPHATELTPGDEVALDVDSLPAWEAYLRRALSNQRERRAQTAAERLLAESRARRVSHAPEPDVEPVTGATADANAAFVQLVQDELSREVEAAALRSAEQEAVRTAERIRLAGLEERARARQSQTAPLSATEALRVDADLAREAAELVMALKSYTRRMFDVARDRNWTRDRVERMKDVIGLAEQLTLVAGIIGDPNKGHATDEALNELLNGR